MKRVKSACILQTLVFSQKDDIRLSRETILRQNRDEFEKYKSPNGWGTTQSALEALKSLKQCIDDIEDPNGWSGWNTFPKELLYVAW